MEGSGTAVEDVLEKGAVVVAGGAAAIASSSTSGDRVGLRKSSGDLTGAVKEKTPRKSQGACGPWYDAHQWNGKRRKSTQGRSSLSSPCAWRSSW